MPTNRVPIKRRRRAASFPNFTPAALDAFRKMQELERKGHIGDEWDDQHFLLRQALGIKPWQFPGVERPGTGTDLEAQARYRLLEEALKQQEPV